MGRPPRISVEKKTRIVLAVVAGEVTVAEAARRETASEQPIGRWKAEFLAARPRWLQVGVGCWPVGAVVSRRAAAHADPGAAIDDR